MAKDESVRMCACTRSERIEYSKQTFQQLTRQRIMLLLLLLWGIFSVAHIITVSSEWNAFQYNVLCSHFAYYIGAIKFYIYFAVNENVKCVDEVMTDKEKIKKVKHWYVNDVRPRRRRDSPVCETRSRSD